MHRSKAENTLRTYRAAVRSWCRWAASHALPALPARSEDVAAYLADMALQGRRTSTIDLHRAALRYLHHLAQIAVPTAHPMVTATLAGIRREAKEVLPRQKTALTWDRLVRVVEAISSHDLVGARDRVILLLGFAGAFRRSELAALKVDDITVDEDGMQIRLGRSSGASGPRGATGQAPRPSEPRPGSGRTPCRTGRSRTSSANAAATLTLRGTLADTACAAAPSPRAQRTGMISWN